MRLHSVTVEDHAPDTGVGEGACGSSPLATAHSPLSLIDRRLLNEFQRNLPLTLTPYADMAQHLGITEQEVIMRLERLQASGTVSRVGPVFRPNRLGASTLAAMAVPQGQLEEVAALVSAHAEVNHNYEREHDYNLWFVVTATNPEHLDAVLDDIARVTGHAVMSLPMLENYHIDLGFDLRWT